MTPAKRAAKPPTALNLIDHTRVADTNTLCEERLGFEVEVEVGVAVGVETKIRGGDGDGEGDGEGPGTRVSSPMRALTADLQRKSRSRAQAARPY